MNSRKPMQKIMIIGAGNVASHMGKRLVECGFEISYVVSRNIQKALHLSSIIGGIASDVIPEIINSVDVIIISINDSEYKNVIESLNPSKNVLVVHTSGSVGMDVFEGKEYNYGVLYPFQTLTKNRDVDFSSVPLFVEFKNEKSRENIEFIAQKLSNNVMEVNSLQRSYIHLAAVFACNFVNHMFVISEDILKTQNIQFSVLHSLIRETFEKAIETSPFELQTGPALRNDQNILQKHIGLIDDPKIREVYQIMSNLIKEKHSENDKL